MLYLYILVIKNGNTPALQEGVKGILISIIVGIFLNAAFVLINAELGTDIVDDLKAIPEVKQVYGVYGVYDYVVRLEADTMEQLKDIVTNQIRRLKNVKSTLTMIVID